VPAAIVDPRYMVHRHLSFSHRAGMDPVFSVELVGLTKQFLLINSVFSVNTDKLLKDVKKTDLIIVPALSGDIRQAVEMNSEFIPWIVDQYNRERRLLRFA
jgi:hypothetical protein